MTLSEAAQRFLEHTGQDNSPVNTKLQSPDHNQALVLLTTYFCADAPLSELAPASLRDFLSRWYIEKACSSKPNDSPSAKPSGPDQILEPHALLDSLAEFFEWADRENITDQASQYASIIIGLRGNLPRALKISRSLSSSLRDRRGAFTFPEFLTSFEEGGSSQYDIDVPGNIGAIDGYFRIIRVEGSSVEAEEQISEERVWPIVFPADVAALLGDGDIINLELVRGPEGWQIAGCGFAYPPGTEI